MHILYSCISLIIRVFIWLTDKIMQRGKSINSQTKGNTTIYFKVKFDPPNYSNNSCNSNLYSTFCKQFSIHWIIHLINLNKSYTSVFGETPFCFQCHFSSCWVKNNRINAKWAVVGATAYIINRNWNKLVRQISISLSLLLQNY